MSPLQNLGGGLLFLATRPPCVFSPTELNRTTKKTPRTFFYLPFSAAEPRRTRPNQHALLFQQQHVLVGTTNFFLPFFGRQTHQTKPNQTEPAHTLPPQTEVEITGAGCFPGATPRRTEKTDLGFNQGGSLCVIVTEWYSIHFGYYFCDFLGNNFRGVK